MISIEYNMHYRVQGLRRCSATLSQLLIVLTGVTGTLKAATGEIVGQTWTGERGIRQTAAEIAGRDKSYVPQSRRPYLHPLGKLPPSAAGQPPAAATTPSSAAPGPLFAQTVSPTVNFTAATLYDCSGYPPDTMGVVGPSQFIIALNGRIRSFNKNTGQADGAINAGTDSFFSSVMTSNPNGNFTSDPRIRYDRLSGRWFITMIDVPGQQGTVPNRIMVAVSDSGTITSGTVWTFYQFEHDLVGSTPNADTGDFADYPTLGIDASALYIGVNVFTSTGSFQNTTAYVVRKSSLLSGGPIVVTAFRGLITGKGPANQSGPFTPQGVDNYNPAATEGYFIGVDVNSRSTLRLRRVATPGGTPALSANVSITVNSYADPINVPHLGNTGGTANYLDCVDRRLMAAHFRNGLLWTSHNVGVNNTGGASSVTRDGVRWYAITNVPTGSSPVVSQSGTVYQPSASNTSDQRSYWMGTIMVSGQGHAAMGFSAAGQNEYANAATCGRLAGDPAGAMQAPSLYTASSSAYNAPYNRWGDYSFTSLDPADDMTMWTVQEWCSSPNVYAVQVARLLAPPPIQLTACTPSVATQGVASVSVAISGPVTNGAGFFEPGPAFSNHLAIAVNGGGVTVSSVTVNNSSNLTAVLAIASNAVPGVRTISVTNPDGQTAISASGLLTIVSPLNHPPTLAPIPDQNVTAGATLTITNTAADPDSPPQTLTFSLSAGSPTNATINAATGVFTWTPTVSQVGTNLVTVVVSDNGTPSLSATQSFFVTVVAPNHPPTITVAPDRIVHALTPLVLTNTATDPDVPPQTLTFSLDPGAPAGASINATNGMAFWTPADSQLGTNSLAVRVTDNGAPNLSDAGTIHITVLPRPALAIAKVSGVAVQLTWNSINGTAYQLQFKTNIADPAWTSLLPQVLATGPTASLTDTNIGPGAYYRVQVVP